MTKVFIDGSAGTTGLRIVERLEARKDLELLILPDELRKSPEARADALASADVAFLCLPDDAAKESAALAAGSKVKIIDTSTAHRTDPNWISIPGPDGPLVCEGRFRHSKTSVGVTVEQGAGGELIVRAQSPVRAPTPGQLAVFYDNDIVIGSAWICRSE